MDPYSLLLAAGIGAAALALVLAIAVRVGLYRARLVQWAPLAAALSVLLVAVAAVFHLLTGHGPGSPAPLEPFAFLDQHLAVLVIPAVALLAVGLGRSPAGERSVRRR